MAIPGFVGLPSYQPFMFVTPGSRPMTFAERLKTTLLYIASNRKVVIPFYVKLN